jgi:hypothetical protein
MLSQIIECRRQAAHKHCRLTGIRLTDEQIDQIADEVAQPRYQLHFAVKFGFAQVMGCRLTARHASA